MSKIHFFTSKFSSITLDPFWDSFHMYFWKFLVIWKENLYNLNNRVQLNNQNDVNYIQRISPHLEFCRIFNCWQKYNWDVLIIGIWLKPSYHIPFMHAFSTSRYPSNYIGLLCLGGYQENMYNAMWKTLAYTGCVNAPLCITIVTTQI